MLRRFVYIQVHRGYITGRLVGSGGGSARRSSPHFDHPRSLFGQYPPIQEAIRSLLRELGSFRFGFIRPGALVHLVPEQEGGYTHAELRAFKQAAEEAGIVFAFMLDSRYGPLTDAQVVDVFRAAGWWRRFV
jgi:hypothetical protein